LGQRVERVVRGVLFDLDGTLVESHRDIAAAANHALGVHGFARLSNAELETYMGDGAPPLLTRAARLLPGDPRLQLLLKDFLDYYAAHPVDNTQLMPGVLDALGTLASFPLGVCTNKPRRTTFAVLEHFELIERFKGVVAGDDLPHRKPHPAPVLHGATLLGVAAEALVMVGDGPQDILSGRAAGAFTVGVRGGIQAEERLLSAEPHEMIDSLAELPALIERLNG
jgi:phosphoglycolate phosphatase